MEVEYNLYGYLYIDGESVKTWTTEGTHYYYWDVEGKSGSHDVKLKVVDSPKPGEIADMDTDTITLSITNSEMGGVEKYGVVVGIANYKIGSCLYADEDASDWYNHLTDNLGWSSSDIKLYGGSDSSDFPKYTGTAKEYIVKKGLNLVVSTVDPNDIFTFTFAGHGEGNGENDSYLKMWDSGSGENFEDGNLTDDELVRIFEHLEADKIFTFLDACKSGGFGDNLMNMSNKENVYLTTTCTDSGSGYSSFDHKNGLWTYYFLEDSWQNHFGGSANTALEDIFEYAHNEYPYNGEDEPQEFDGDPNNFFYLSP